MNSASATATSAHASPHATSTHALAGNYNLAVGYLRAFVTLLVLAHHAALAYHPFPPARTNTLAAQPRWWEAFPVVEPHKWMGWSFFTGFNDVFFMSLMSLLSSVCTTQHRAQGSRRVPARSFVAAGTAFRRRGGGHRTARLTTRHTS